MADKKIFVGNGRQVTSWKRGISICIDDVKQYATVAKNGKSYVNLSVEDLKEKNQWGKDVTVVVDTWKPGDQKPKKEGTFGPESFEEDRLPF